MSVRRICAVITSYYPPDDFWRRCNLLRSTIGEVVVVDNTPGGTTPPADFQGILLSDGRNKGLGSALNIGAAWATEKEFAWLLLFDQDSTVPDDFAERMLAAAAEAAKLKAQPIGAIAPVFVDDDDGALLLSRAERARSATTGIDDVSCLATSGMLIPIKAFQAAGPFSEALFLDFVDFEWCWRARKAGFSILRTRDVRLPHRLGLGARSFLGLRYHVPNDFRHYFQFRDSLFIALSAAAPLYDRLRLIALLPPKLLLYPLILDQGGTRLKWMLLGIRDFIVGRRGIGAAAQRIGMARHQWVEQ